jgi:hypothetical protein
MSGVTCIRSKGVIRFQTACLVPTQGTVPAADRAALEDSELARQRKRQAKIAASMRTLGLIAFADQTAPNGASIPATVIVV